jgi:hypothetical protein
VSDQEYAELLYLRDLEQAVTSLLEGYLPAGRLSLCLPADGPGGTPRKPSKVSSSNFNTILMCPT